ncbi:ABC transporter ATP-binding protein [Phytoactinopolyspora halotolerans]|uniref:ABC transporter ATP-binding protein n=1 Tax=Phytoactinopolyspora halotolerans TaxID=1981512 RepID=A0A6L9S9S1_9ACTN|nr:ABC transporter ATP-binding protein [Phytoactinopolyspora halotolerans]NEE01986.1 ABC transporter ATP-binding protein [Phytoactinopolyspora halotolerans]
MATTTSIEITHDAAASGREPAEPLIAVRDLSVSIDGNEIVTIDQLDIPHGARLGLIGESGAGKTITALSLLDLQPRHATRTGSVRLEGRELVGLTDRELSRIRGADVGVVLQDPASALNPLTKVGRQVDEALRLHTSMSRRERKERVIELMSQVQLPDPNRLRRRYPHQLSGGQRQRIMIAIGIANSPKLLIADEPSSSLDVNVQAEILDLLVRLGEEQQMGILFISHNLGVVRTICDRVAVLYGGTIVEQGPVDTVLGHPRHWYTEALIAANPEQLASDGVEGSLNQPLWPIPGETPSPGHFPSGCRFSNRCPHATDACAAAPPITRSADDTSFTCWNPADPQPTTPTPASGTPR